METLIPLLIIIIIIGAILGGKSFGDTVRKGCGFLIILLIIALLIIMIAPWNSTRKNNQETINSTYVSAYFTVIKDCVTYTKPDINSETSGNLEKGHEIFVKNSNKYKYFYEINQNNGKCYVKKEFLEKIE